MLYSQRPPLRLCLSLQIASSKVIEVHYVDWHY